MSDKYVVLTEQGSWGLGIEPISDSDQAKLKGQKEKEEKVNSSK